MGASPFFLAHHLARTWSKISSKVRLAFSLGFPILVSDPDLPTLSADAKIRPYYCIACGPNNRRCLKRHFADPLHPSSSELLHSVGAPPSISSSFLVFGPQFSPFTCLVYRRVQSYRELWNVTVPEEPIMPGRRVVVRSDHRVQDLERFGNLNAQPCLV